MTSPMAKDQSLTRLTCPLALVIITTLMFTSCPAVLATTHDCPAACRCQGAAGDHLEVDCSRGALSKPPRTGLNTVTLDLSHNGLGPIINATFARMSNLSDLDLSHNGIRRLLGCTFNGMLSLRRVVLRGNRLAALPDSLFTDSNGVEVLDLSHNIFTSLPDHVFRNTPNLKRLDLSHNRLVELTLGLRFQVPRHLNHLDLSDNLFESVESDSFQMANQWEGGIPRTLSLARCKLTYIQAGALTQIPDLNDLDLSGNPDIPAQNLTSAIKELERQRLETLSLAGMNLTNISAFFTQVSLLALKSLNVSDNAIHSLPSGMFSTVRSLRVLDLSHNRLTSLKSSIKDLVNLEVLNLSSNALVSFKGRAVNGLSKLQVLDVSDNRLASVSDVIFRPLKKLRQLKVKTNLLPSVILPETTNNLVELDYSANSVRQFGGFTSAPKLEIFDISDNDLEKVQEFLFQGSHLMKVANFSQNSITELDPRAFLPQSPLVIDLSHNFLTMVQFSNWVATQELYLNHNQLAKVDMQTFHRMTGLRRLDMSENNITALHEDLFYHTSALEHLNLAHNAITQAHFSLLFRHLGQLQTLHLGSNNISQLNETMLAPIPKLRRISARDNKLEIIMPRVFRDLKFIQEIDLSNNPFSCICDMLALRDWLSRTQVPITGLYKKNSSAYLCHGPASRAGMHVMRWEPGQFECDEVMLYMIVFGSIGLTLIAAGIISTVVHRLYLRHRQKKKEARKAKLEIERLGEKLLTKPGRKGELKRMTSEEIAEEITEAIERRERKSLRKAKAEESKKGNGYVPWPAGKKDGDKTKAKDREHKRGGATDVGNEASAKKEKGRARSPERLYDHLTRVDGGRMELVERGRDRRDRERDEWHEGRRERSREYIDVDGGVIRLRRDKPPPPTAHPSWKHPDRGYVSDQERGYRPAEPSRRGVPYVMGRPARSRWDGIEVWDRDARGWIIPGQRRSRSHGHRHERDEHRYLTMPIREQDYLRARSQDRGGRGRPAMYLDRYTNEIRYGVEDLRRYPQTDPRRSRRDLYEGRSRSYHHLPSEYPRADDSDGPASPHHQRNPQDAAAGHGERQAYADDKRGLLIGSRAVSQPFLANEKASDWL